MHNGKFYTGVMQQQAAQTTYHRSHILTRAISKKRSSNSMKNVGKISVKKVRRMDH